MTTPWPKKWPNITAKSFRGIDLDGPYSTHSRGTDKLIFEKRYLKKVEAGDTISGYSQVLYGNYNELFVWGRIKAGCGDDPKSILDIMPLASVNVIKTGETLVHVGEYLNNPKKKGSTDKTPLVTRPTPQITLRGGVEIVAADFKWLDSSDFIGLDRAAIGEYITTGWTSGYVILEDIPTFVSGVRNAAAGRPISLLHIQVHGEPSVMHFGDTSKNGDFLSFRTLPTYRAELQKLKFSLGSGAWVVARSCNTGASLDLLRGLRDLWNVNILGGTGIWRNVLDYNTGKYVILEAGGDEYYVNSMPSQIQSSLMRKAWKNR